MNKILILFGHPAFKRSTINAALRKAVENLEGITFHDLYASYPAIVLQTLREKGLMNTSPGKSIFSVLLFQDLAVIPMLAILPLLATALVHTDAHHGSGFFDITTLPAYLRLIVVLLAIGVIFVVGKYGSRPIFRAIAASRVREVFVAAALALVIGISLLMTAVGLSPALGTFLAGVVLATLNTGTNMRVISNRSTGFCSAYSSFTSAPAYFSLIDEKGSGDRYGGT